MADPLPSSLPIPPIFSDEDLTLPDDFLSFDDHDFDITFDDIHLHLSEEDFFNSAFKSSTNNPIDLSSDDPEFNDFVSDPDSSAGHQSSDVSGFLNLPENESLRVSENSSPELQHENPVSSQGSAAGSDAAAGASGAMNCPSPDSGNSVVDRKVKREITSSFVLKRKNLSSDGSPEKYRRSNEGSTTTETENSNELNEKGNEKDEKKKARLIRNRESAQLSRQRKKHYVEELEDKVRAMHSTIQDLNARITYFAAENATLKQQMVVSGGCGSVGGGVGQPLMYPPHPAMAPMGYPWMPCPPYVVKSHGSQVPLVPIPRLKPQQQQPLSSSQKLKKVEVKKTEGITTINKTKSKTKTKKVASISFLGFLLFIMLFGGLVPSMNVKFDGGYSSGSIEYRLYEQQQHPGRVLVGGDHVVNGTTTKTNHRASVGGSGRGHEDNASEPLVASLYVPRNDKLVKIDGNLIIHSVLASEKAMASQEEEEQGMTTKKEEDTGLAVALDLVPAISVPAVGRNGGRQPHMYRGSSDRQRALSSDNENLKTKPADGKLQQWFREGLAGPMLSSGMCTEVFQFDVSVASASGAIVPATSVANITAEDHRQNSTYITATTVKNRRILHGLPIPISNVTKEHVAGNESKHEEHHKNNSVSSMVVSVLVDPREAGDGGGDVDGMMGGKSFSRIFVVVLLDSVKYVTYSCMLPLKGVGHLVTA